MAIIEINLEKPALVEERRVRGASSGQSKSASRRSSSGGSGGGRGKLLGLLAVLAGIGLLVARMRGGGETEVDVGVETGSMDEMDEMDEDTTESAGGGMGKFVGALGLVVALAGVVVAVLKRRH